MKPSPRKNEPKSKPGKPLCIVSQDGSKCWYLNGSKHREDGPACEWSSGSKSWWINDIRHREDGPAIERTGGWNAWYIHGVKYTEEEFKIYQLTIQLAGL